jgi:hypothetical protein
LNTALKISELWIVEGIEAATTTPIEVGGVRIDGASAIDPTTNSRHFLVVFPSIITYQVTAESYVGIREPERRTPGVFTQFSTSEFLEFARSRHCSPAITRGTRAVSIGTMLCCCLTMWSM